MAEPKPRLIVYSKEDCHLCALAKAALLPLCEKYRIPLEEIDITRDPKLLAQYGEEIPVGFLNGEKVFKYRVESKRLRRLLRKATASLIF